MVDLDKIEIGCIVQSLSKVGNSRSIGSLHVVEHKYKNSIQYIDLKGELTSCDNINYFNQITEKPWWEYLQKGDMLTSLKDIGSYRSKNSTHEFVKSDGIRWYYKDHQGASRFTKKPLTFLPDSLSEIALRCTLSRHNHKRYSIW